MLNDLQGKLRKRKVKRKGLLSIKKISEKVKDRKNDLSGLYLRPITSLFQQQCNTPDHFLQRTWIEFLFVW